MGEIPRRLVDEMPAKLEEIERLAREWFAEKMAVDGYMFDANGNLVADPSHPHDPVLVPPSLTPEEAARPLRETWRALQSDLGTLHIQVARFYSLEPVDFTTFVGMLGGPVKTVAPKGVPTSVRDRINDAYGEWVRPVDGMINEEQWSGDAATSFQKRFLEPFHTASEQQQAYAQILAMTAQVYHDAVTVAHRRLLNIADVTIAQLSGGTAATLQYDHVEALSWVSIITAGLSLYPPLGMVAGTFLSWTSFLTGVSGYGLSKVDVPADPVTIEGDGAPQIIQSALKEVLAVERTLAGIDDEVAATLGKELDSPSGFASSTLRLDRPDLADGPGDMRRLTIDKESATNNDVVVAVAKVYEAGYVNLPGAAGQYAQAQAILASCVPSGAAYTYFARSVPLFVEARDVLFNILGNVGESLRDSGKALVACATEYELTDEESAAYLQRVGDLVQPTAETPGTPRTGPV